MVGSKIEVPSDEYAWELYHRKVGSDAAARELGERLAALLEPRLVLVRVLRQHLRVELPH